MNKESYHRLIKNPQLLSSTSLLDLEDLVAAYPYVENFRILYALNLLILDDYRYQENLYKAAFHSSDRKKLKSWVDLLIQDEEKQLTNEEAPALPNIPIETLEVPKTEITKEVSKDILEKGKTKHKESEISETNDLNVLAPQEESKPRQRETISQDKTEQERKKKAKNTKSELLYLVRKRLAEIEAEKKEEQDKDSKIHSSVDNLDIKAQLIDRFLEKQPSISRPDKSDFFDPNKEAIDSTIDDDDFFITETLAQIHRQQGNLNKAIEIYKKLILKNPEKSTYFAAQIQELNKK